MCKRNATCTRTLILYTRDFAEGPPVEALEVNGTLRKFGRLLILALENRFIFKLFLYRQDGSSNPPLLPSDLFNVFRNDQPSNRFERILQYRVRRDVKSWFITDEFDLSAFKILFDTSKSLIYHFFVPRPHILLRNRLRLCCGISLRFFLLGQGLLLKEAKRTKRDENRQIYF